MQNSRWTRPFTVVALSVRARDWPQPLVHQGVTASINCVTLTAWRPGDRKNQANYRAGDLSLTWGGVREGFYNWKQKRKKKKALSAKMWKDPRDILSSEKASWRTMWNVCYLLCKKWGKWDYMNFLCKFAERNCSTTPCNRIFSDDENVLYFSWLTQQPLATDDTWIVANVTKEHNF